MRDLAAFHGIALDQRVGRALDRALDAERAQQGARQGGLAGAEVAIKSPTYTLIERYPVEGGEVAHLNLYRIADPEELSFLGLDELADSARLWLVEWPDRGAAFLPAADLRIELAVEGAGRRAGFEALSPLGADWLAALADQK